MQQPKKSIAFTPLGVEDLEYLYSLCRQTMQEYVVSIWDNWDETAVRHELQRALLAGEFLAIHYGDTKVGAIAVTQHLTHHQLEEIYIAPPHQNKGIGSRVITEVAEAAHAADKPVRLRVLSSNPVKQLYERLGFKVTKTTPTRYFMEKPCLDPVPLGQ